MVGGRERAMFTFYMLPLGLLGDRGYAPGRHFDWAVEGQNGNYIWAQAVVQECVARALK